MADAVEDFKSKKKRVKKEEGKMTQSPEQNPAFFWYTRCSLMGDGTVRSKTSSWKLDFGCQTTNTRAFTCIRMHVMHNYLLKIN